MNEVAVGISSPHAPAADDPLVAALADELTQRWRQGERILAETLLARHPELWDTPARALGLVYEEICIRQELGLAVSDQELARRFPRWRTQLDFMRACHDLLEPAPAAAPPRVGDTIAGYRLLAPLGTGAGGRVFLAAQPALGDRPVVVKLTARHGSEHCRLARLQHTYIVPLYAAHDDPARDLRVLCMPYFGGAAFDEVLSALGDRPVPQRVGADLLVRTRTDHLQWVGSADPLLASLSYPQAVCWIGACLAEALHYAHEVGILHLDLKPSNILMTAQGQPMLLDFHLARRPIAAGADAGEGLGGTPGYMPPEQEAGLRAVQCGRAVPHAIDRRADLYALGAVLYEALGGSLPYVPGRSPPLRRLNAQVSVGLSDIIERCLAAEPDRRFPDAAALADDLHRHLSDQPLRGVANRSWVERYRKWQRRNPTAKRTVSLWAAILAAAAIMLSWGAAAWRETRSDARRALHEARAQWQVRGEYTAARGRLHAALGNLNRWPRVDALADELAGAIAEVEEAEAAATRRAQARELHRLAERARVLYGVEGALRGQQRLGAACATFWERRRDLRRWLDASDQPGAVEDLTDVALFAAEVRLAASGANRRSALEQYLTRLDEIRELLGPSAVLETLRRRQLRALEMPVPTGPLPAVRSDWERFTLGRLALRDGDAAEAERYLEAALASLRHGFWPNYYAGIRRWRAGDFAGALACFSVCVGAAPAEPTVYYNRALAFAGLGDRANARADYDRALELDGSFASAALNRALLHYDAGDWASAERDLQHALAVGADAATVHYNLALVYHASSRDELARTHLERAVASDAAHAGAKALLRRLSPQP